MYSNKKLWTGLFERDGLRSCKEFWVYSQGSPWLQIERSLPAGHSLIAIIPGSTPAGMRWSPVEREPASEQQLIDVWDTNGLSD